MQSAVPERLEIDENTYSEAIELASLVLFHISSSYKNLLEEDFILLQTLKKGLNNLKAGTKKDVKAIIDGEERIFTPESISELETFLQQKQEKYDHTKKELRV